LAALECEDECEGQKEINRIDGTVSYICSLEPRLAQKLRRDWEKICDREGIERSFRPRYEEVTRDAEWFVDESEIDAPDGRKLLALCVAEVLDPSEISRELKFIADEEANDSFGSSDGEKIVTKGIHWNEATWSLRERAVKALAASPIRAIVALAPLANPKEYKNTYLALLDKIMDVALRSADDASVSIVVEANAAKVSRDAVERAICTTHERLRREDRRRPISPPMVLVRPKGATMSMCVPDIMLGCFAAYATCKKASDGKKATLDEKLFERVRTRFSTIVDGYSGKEYGWWRPFRGWL